jgi:hypothetical protein
MLLARTRGTSATRQLLALVNGRKMDESQRVKAQLLLCNSALAY